MKRAARELRLDVGWGELAALAWPNPGAPRVLCLHGWMDNAASFAPLAEHLADFDLVALEYAGHGHSDHRPRGARYYLHDYFFDAVAALDALGWSRCRLVGHSLGTAIAVTCAAAEPARVEAIALLDGLGMLSEPGSKAVDRLRRSLASVRRDRRHRRAYRDIEQAALVRQANNPMALDSARLLAERALQGEPGALSWRTDPRIMWTSPQYGSEAAAQAVLAGVECPALVWATPTITDYLGERFEARLACLVNHRLVQGEGSHHVHMDRPETVAPDLIELLHGKENFA